MVFPATAPALSTLFAAAPPCRSGIAVPAVDSAAEVWYTVRMKHAAELDKKRTYMDKGRIRAATALGCIALTACVSVWIAHAFDTVAAARAFAILFYPTAVIIVTGCWFSAAELLRNRYISAGAALHSTVSRSYCCSRTLFYRPRPDRYIYCLSPRRFNLRNCFALHKGAQSFCGCIKFCLRSLAAYQQCRARTA